MKPVRVSKTRELVALEYDQRIANIVPHRLRESNGRTFMLLPHRVKVCKLLRNFGINVPAPILSRYDWNQTTPFDSQRDTAAMLTINSRAYVLSEMGTGKTRGVLYAIDYLLRRKEIKKVLVVSPLSTLTSVWEREIFEVTPQYDSVALHGTKPKRLAALKSDVTFYIINHDGVATIQEALIARPDIDCVVIDELSAFRNATTKRWKILNKVLQGRKYVWGLTGSPTPNEPTDVYGQEKLLTPERVPRYMKPFRSELMLQITTFKWVPRPGATEAAYKAMQPSVRYMREDCYDLPPVTYSDRSVTMGKDQRKIYNKMLKEFQVQYNNEEITAANEGVKLGKLLQIACGFVYSNKKQKVLLPNNDRINVLTEIIEEASGKVIVFVPFIHALQEVAKQLAGVTSLGVVYGATPKKERDDIFQAFQHEDTPKVLVAHPRTASHGLTLTAANTIVWFSPTASLETYAQACARITRYSQTRHAHIIHLVGSDVEKRIYTRLRNKDKMQGALLDMFNQPAQETMTL